MKGQIWVEYLLMVAAVTLVAMMAMNYAYQPVKSALTCSATHMRALSEIVRQKLVDYRDYFLMGVECNLEGGVVTVHCSCGEPNSVRSAVSSVLSELGVSASVEVRP